MKISKLFHTLYAFLMFLPVMVLPLFAININQKEVEPLTAQIEETQVVNFNQLVPTIHIEGSYSEELTDQYGAIDVWYAPLSYNHIYYTKLDYVTNYDFWFKLGTLANANYLVICSASSSHASNYATCVDYGSSLSQQMCFQYPDNYEDFDMSYYNLNVFDLTAMFGAGNEPTAAQFDLWYPNDSYAYSLPHKEILYTGVVDTLDNTDIGSQFLYSLYNPLHDYFNLPNYMNLGGLYNWFLANLFSGYNSPVFFIIFTLMIYWLALSLLWLIFDVLMYVPSMIHKMLDKARME